MPRWIRTLSKKDKNDWLIDWLIGWLIWLFDWFDWLFLLIWFHWFDWFGWLIWLIDLIESLIDLIDSMIDFIDSLIDLIDLIDLIWLIDWSIGWFDQFWLIDWLIISLGFCLIDWFDWFDWYDDKAFLQKYWQNLFLGFELIFKKIITNPRKRLWIEFEMKVFFLINLKDLFVCDWYDDKALFQKWSGIFFWVWIDLQRDYNKPRRESWNWIWWWRCSFWSI